MNRRIHSICCFKIALLTFVLTLGFLMQSVFASGNAPSGLRILSKSDRAVSLTWNTISSPPLDCVAIYCNDTKVKEVPVNDQNNSGYRGAVIRELEPDTEYKFTAKAVYANGDESDFSNEVLVTTDADSKKNEGQNIAMSANLSVSSSASEILWPADCAVDGSDSWLNVRNQWLSQWGKGTGAWMMFDFGEVRYINKWVIKHIGVTGQTYNTVDFDLMVSDDNENWTTVKQYKDNTSDITEFVPDSPISGRYFKIVCVKTAAAPDGDYARISEVELYSAIGVLSLSAEPKIRALGTGDTQEAFSVKALMSDDTQKTVSDYALTSADLSVVSVSEKSVNGVKKGVSSIEINAVVDGKSVKTAVPMTVSDITVHEMKFTDESDNEIAELSGAGAVCGKALISNKSGEAKSVVAIIAHYNENGQMTKIASSAFNQTADNNTESLEIVTEPIDLSDASGTVVLYLWSGFGGKGSYVEAVNLK